MQPTETVSSLWSMCIMLSDGTLLYHTTIVLYFKSFGYLTETKVCILCTRMFEVQSLQDVLYLEFYCIVQLSCREIDLKTPENQSIYSIMALIFKSFHSTNLFTLVQLNQRCSDFHIQSFCIDSVTATLLSCINFSIFKVLLQNVFTFILITQSTAKDEPDLDHGKVAFLAILVSFLPFQFM